jgi:hypothetical protein
MPRVEYSRAHPAGDGGRLSALPDQPRPRPISTNNQSPTNPLRWDGPALPSGARARALFWFGRMAECRRPERASAGFLSQWLVCVFAGSVTSSAMFNPIPGRDPNEAYHVIPSPARLRMPAGWLTVTCNGIPVQHFGPASRHLAEHYATDPEPLSRSRLPHPQNRCTPREAVRHHAASSSNRAFACFQVDRVKALGEPAVDRSEKFSGLVALPLLSPKPRHARDCAQLKGFRLLCTRDFERPFEIRFGSCELCGRCPSEPPLRSSLSSWSWASASSPARYSATARF